MRILLIGLPGKVIDRGACIVMSMQHTGEKLPALPKSTCASRTSYDQYCLYCRQTVEERGNHSEDPEDVLIVEEFPQIDSKTASIAVL